MSRCSKPSLALMLLLACLSAMVLAVRAQQDDPELLDPDETWHANHCTVPKYDFDSDVPEFVHMMFRLNTCLLTWATKQVFEHWALCVQSELKGDQPPCGYVIVPLKGLNGDECTLALRADNLYLAAFANAKKKWFVFPRYAHLFPTATVLRFGTDYSDLLGVEHETRVKQLPLGKHPSLQAASQMSRHEEGPPGSQDEYIKLAVATIVLTIPEAKRFTPIRQAIASGWDQGTTLNDVEALYLINWRTLSCSLLVAEKTGVWGADKDAKGLMVQEIAKTKEQALGIVDILLQPKNRGKSKCEYPS